MATDGPKNVRVVALVEGPDPDGAYRAGVLSGVLSYVAAGCVGETRDAALAALEERLAHLGYDARISPHDDLEAARAEVARRRTADELLGCVASPFPERLAELLPDRPDAVAALETLTDALAAASRGLRRDPE